MFVKELLYLKIVYLFFAIARASPPKKKKKKKRRENGHNSSPIFINYHSVKVEH